MRVKIGNAVLVALVLLTPLTASAQNVDWATCDYSTTLSTSCTTAGVSGCCTMTAANMGVGSGNNPILIPMDRCHQAFSNSGTNSADETNTSRVCVDPNPYNVHGMFYAYGLVYRLMQQGIPVYWIVNPTKYASAVADYHSTSEARYPMTDNDAWIMTSDISTIPTSAGSAAGGFRNATYDCPSGTCTPPVTRLNSTTLAAATTSPTRYSRKAFPIKGGAFMIAGANRAAFNTFWNKFADGTPSGVTSTRNCASGNSCWDFTAVTLYEIDSTAKFMWRDYVNSADITSIPVAVKIDYQPPRIARVDPQGGVSTNWLAEANLDDGATYPQCLNAQFAPTDAVYCNVTEADVNLNKLVSGGFGWAWLDGGNGFGTCSQVSNKLKIFMSEVPNSWVAGNTMVNDKDIQSIEGCTDGELLGKTGTGTGLSTSGSAVNEAQDQPFIVRYPTNLFMQFGDIPLSFASSSVASWSSDNTHQYSSLYTGANNTLKRLVTREKVWSATNTLCGDTQTSGNGWKKVAATSGGPDKTADAAENPHQNDLYPHNNLGTCAPYDMSTAALAAVSDVRDMASYGRYNNNVRNGVVFYTPGNNISTSKAELRIVLNSIIATPQGQSAVTETLSYERSRSSPVVASVNGGVATAAGGPNAVVQGTELIETDATGLQDSPAKVLYEENADTFTFPFRKGHMRAINADTSTNTTFAASSPIFDAGCNATFTGFTCPTGTAGIPPTTNTYTGTCSVFPKDAASAAAPCRTIFTTSDRGSAGVKPTMEFFDQNVSATVKSLLKTGATLSDAAALKIVQRVIAGKPDGSGGYVAVLGGVDRSTPAVIEASNVAKTTKSSARPTMAYFGAGDGMLHAVCAQVNTAYGCDKLGRELWAYIPRTLLPYLRLNTAKIDGSPRVLDAYEDFYGAGKVWRTILMFHTAMGDAAYGTSRLPAVYAIDITDPSDPVVLWEYSLTDPTALGTYEMGVGLTLAAGKVLIGSTTYDAVWAQTNSAGLATSANVVTALDLTNGNLLYQKGYTYPSPRVSTDDVVGDSEIPGGVVPVDLTGAGRVTDLVWADLYGDVWFASADTGVSHTGATTPLFKATDDYYAIGGKPAILGVGTSQYAVFGTGGFADPTALTWPVACKDTTGTNVCSIVSTTALPLQFTMGLKLNSALTASVVTPTTECDSNSDATYPACTDTNVRFWRKLGQDERVYSQPLIVGDEVFFATDLTNVNLDSYQVSTTNTGHMYHLETSGKNVAAPTVIVAGVSALASNGGLSTGKGVFRGGGTGVGYTTAATTSGSSVDSSASAAMSRRLWLRTE